ncbi:hypothetical protein BCR35DRAFT_285723 [Leucosporidium creatinivorum]|uniref:tRNA-binding domain-containing protein n=1 Tax=Leucosporidium creatinivorum TaxID=106004 RepID=A0A1Y2G368_9BASI|nr:hypothetical protein BCR35DRAFT_285723 [Leucosporidium creatinivorum]
MSTLSLTQSTPAGRAASLLAAVYGQYVPELTVSQGDKLSLTTSSGEVSSLPEVAVALFEAGGKSNDALGASDEEKKGVKSWLSRIGEGQFEKEEGVKTLDGELQARTYLVGETVTAADLSLVAALHPYISSATHSLHLSHPSVTRHFDHIQHLPSVAPSLPTLFTPSPVVIDANNVPVVEIKQDVKVKKPKAAAAAEGTAAGAVEAVAAPVKEAAKKVEEVVKDAAAAVLPEGVVKGVKKEKKEKKGGEGKRAPPPPPVVEAPAPWQIDLRVGRIIDVKVHPDADSLYVEQIDVGEAEPRTVVSGLVKYKTLEEMQGATLITVCNLKPANMRGVKSFAMVLCASAKEGKEGGIEFVDPPAGSVPGDRVYFEGFEDKVALDLLNPKKKIFETVQPGFTTLDTKEAAWVSPEGAVHKIVTAKGVCAPKTLVGASLS